MYDSTPTSRHKDRLKNPETRKKLIGDTSNLREIVLKGVVYFFDKLECDAPGMLECSSGSGGPPLTMNTYGAFLIEIPQPIGDEPLAAKVTSTVRVIYPKNEKDRSDHVTFSVTKTFKPESE